MVGSHRCENNYQYLCHLTRGPVFIWCARRGRAARSICNYSFGKRFPSSLGKSFIYVHACGYSLVKRYLRVYVCAPVPLCSAYIIINDALWEYAGCTCIFTIIFWVIANPRGLPLAIVSNYISNAFLVFKIKGLPQTIMNSSLAWEIRLVNKWLYKVIFLWFNNVCNQIANNIHYERAQSFNTTFILKPIWRFAIKCDAVRSLEYVIYLFDALYEVCITTLFSYVHNTRQNHAVYYANNLSLALSLSHSLRSLRRPDVYNKQTMHRRQTLAGCAHLRGDQKTSADAREIIRK